MGPVSSGARSRVLFLMGPTATGKTDLAVELLEPLNGEIISVDSTLVYRGMDIGTAKPDAELLARAPHHLIDIRDPAEPYSAADFAADATPLIRDICARGRVPILVGGTMLYFRVLLEGLADLPSADPALRAELVAEAGRRGWPALHDELARVDPASAAELHPNHSQRIVRALEIYRLTGRPASRLKAEGAGGVPPLGSEFEIRQMALLPRDRALLHRRIAERFYLMLELGLVEEVQRLRERGDLNRELPAIRAVGYRQVWDYLAGDVTREEMVARAVAASRQLAKRQLTWLRKWRDLEPLTIDDGRGRVTPRRELVEHALKLWRR